MLTVSSDRFIQGFEVPLVVLFTSALTGSQLKVHLKTAMQW